MRRFFAVALVVALSGCDGHVGEVEVRFSDAAAHVPPPAEFDALMVRDLTAHFRAAYGENVTVRYELLREEPTQTGISFPKYYAWVTMRRQSGAVEEGAARIAAIDRTRFEVTDFISAADARARPEELSSVFPAPVVEKIDGRVR